MDGEAFGAACSWSRWCLSLRGSSLSNWDVLWNNSWSWSWLHLWSSLRHLLNTGPSLLERSARKMLLKFDDLTLN